MRNRNCTCRIAARLNSVPKSTLRHYINRSRGKGVILQNGCGRGGKPAIPLQYEKPLADCLRVLEKWGFGMSRDEVLDMVQTFVVLNDIKTRLKGRQGAEWFLNFTKRHNLSVKKPQGNEYVRMNQVNPFVIYGLVHLLEKTIQENGLSGKPHLIYNSDDTSFGHDPSQTKVVGQKGEKCTCF